MPQEQKDILQLVHTSQFEKALEELTQINSDLAWRDALELRLLRLLKKGKQALKLANSLHKKKATDIQLLRYIALIFSDHNKTQDALKIYKKIAYNDNVDVNILLEHGITLSAHGDLDNAEKQLKKGRALAPSNANFHSQLGRIYCRTGRVKIGLECYQRAAFIEPKKVQHLQRLTYWGNYSEQTSQQSNFHMARLWAKRAFPKNQTGSNTWRDANPNKPLKIGFISGDFCAHAVSFFITPLLENINREQFVIHGYSDVKKPDDITKNIQSLCDTWHDASEQNDDLLGAQLGADQLDVLVDLSGHSANNRLGIFAQHIAPIQISWLGYPSTTGLDSINYRISDTIADPETQERDYYTEELIRLKNSFLCYQPYENSPDIQAFSANNSKTIRFGSFNNLAKISPITLDAWAMALHATPNSSLYIKRQQLINDCAKDHLIQEFSKRGIEKDRLILKTSKAKIQDHLAEYNNIDIALDTSPYNGTTTTLESLWMGTPIISLQGNTHASRVSASILHQIGLDNLVANNIQEFASISSDLASNPKRLKQLSNSLRSDLQASHLMNHQQFAKDFGDAIREKWKLWCYARNTEQGIQGDEKIIGGSTSAENSSGVTA